MPLTAAAFSAVVIVNVMFGFGVDGGGVVIIIAVFVGRGALFLCSRWCWRRWRCCMLRLLVWCHCSRIFLCVFSLPALCV